MEPIELIRLADGGPTGAVAYLGSEWATGERSLEFDDRIGRCFELACFALVFGDAPASSRLVHGSWHGPKAEQRIRHAWLELPDGLLWEPIRAAVYVADDLRRYARMWDERAYAKPHAARLAHETGHYGPWHESRYP